MTEYLLRGERELVVGFLLLTGLLVMVLVNLQGVGSVIETKSFWNVFAGSYAVYVREGADT